MNHPTTTGPARARRRDRRVYLAAHPVLFVLLAGLRRRPVVRLGSRVVVNGPAELREVLTDLPLDRTDARTTGGAIRRHEGEGALFDETGEGHRLSRRALAARLDARGVAALRPAWRPVLDAAAARMDAGATVDLCALADDVAGRTTATLLGFDDLDPAGCRALAVAARRSAASAAAAEVPGLRRRRYEDALAAAFGDRVDPLAKMLALATVNTTYAALPRAVARTADAGLWATAGDDVRRPVLVQELLRVTAPTPLLPRVPAAPGRVGGHRVGPGDQLLLLARHAAAAGRPDVDVDSPEPAGVAQLVFGAGRHACPGAGLARAQLDDLLAVLAAYRPVVVRARADRRAALPAWRSLVVRAG